MAQGASSSGILAGGYGGLGSSVSPTTTGNVLFTTDGSVWSSTQKIAQGTSVASTSGTSVTFTGIPSWVKRITFMLRGVGTSATTTTFQIQLGTSGGIVSTGYNSSFVYISTSSVISAGAFRTDSFCPGTTAAAADLFSTTYTISSFDTNIWTGSGTGIRTNTTGTFYCGAVPMALGGTLTQIRLTTVAGSTFNAGSVNILYE
jgi:hypothetical protein